LGLLLASDIVLMAPDASITPYYSVVGFSPDGGWTALIPYIIGPKRAAEILMRNQTITAEQAVKWGVANHIVATSDIRREAQEIALEIASRQAGSLQQTKQLLISASGDIAARLEAERTHFVEQISKEENQKSMLSFLEGM
jgi:enoyl-CoA hydratase/carnithine racemase